jgi:hypothetical protein
VTLENIFEAVLAWLLINSFLCQGRLSRIEATLELLLPENLRKKKKQTEPE